MPLRPVTENLDLIFFARPREGCHLFFSLPSLYDLAKFEYGYNFKSIWVHKSMESWRALLAGVGLQGHILLSRPCDGSLSGHADRPAPFVSISTAGLLALTASWAHSSRRWCGMSKAENSDAARVFLEGLLVLVEGAEWDMQLFLGCGAEYFWPRPPWGAHPILLHVDSRCKVDSGPLEAVMVAGDALPGDSAGCASYLMGMLQGEQMRLTNIIAALCKTRKHAVSSSNLAQVVWATGGEVERRLQAMELDAGAHAQCSIQLSSLDISTDYKLDRVLKRSDMARQVFVAPQFLSLSSDCSRVGTQSLQNAFLATDTNKACWMVPQVPNSRDGLICTLPGLPPFPQGTDTEVRFRDRYKLFRVVCGRA